MKVYEKVRTSDMCSKAVQLKWLQSYQLLPLLLSINYF